MTHSSRRGLAMLAATITATAVALAPMSPALAADGDDPTWYGCDSGAQRLVTAQMPDRQLRMVDPANGAVIGYAYLIYSPTCETQWVKVNYNSGYYPQPSVWRQNQSGTNQYISQFSPWGGTVWTYVLDGMRTQAGCGGVQIYRGVSGGSGHVGWYYLGCA
ncbi:hypothetical protein [Micromonospora echinofusca]|uniref:Peptidase inhibitor family I36 n=1 Tax=Micromonospora echinofusca TaxID=47858 RepID=A0ABS3VMU0_MICEH|nr:hypothetical protein [Micromonospora echinofusca]MBO4205876.1 hypothetical protein [Micromonospora echinofusca]